MIDLTKPVQTRDGRKARIICTDVVKKWPVMALVTNESGGEFAIYCHSDGRTHSGRESPNDLVNVPEQTVLYVGINRNGGTSIALPRRQYVEWDDHLKLTYEREKLVAVEIAK